MMSALTGVLIVVCLISGSTFVAFFGRLPELYCGPINYLHQLIWIQTPHLLSPLDRHFTNGRIGRSMSRFGQYLKYRKNPIVLIFFLSLLSGGAVLFISVTWSLLPFYHKVTVPFLVPLPYIFTYLCNKSGSDAPHITTMASQARNVSRYPYDYKLFHPNIYCQICQFNKPARSRHCSLCGVCVARADHHCAFVNNCIGYGNYKHFLALLLSTTTLLAYATWLAYLTLAPHVRDHLAQQSNRQPHAGGDGSAHQVLVHIHRWHEILDTALLVGGVAHFGVGVLALFTAPLSAGLLAYHSCLIWGGMTTYERGKWRNWREEVLDGMAYVAPIIESSQGAQKSTWPNRSREFLVLTSDGLSPRNLPPEIEAVIGKRVEWRRCGSIMEVQNIYNLGPWRNLKEIFLN